MSALQAADRPAEAPPGAVTATGPGQEEPLTLLVFRLAEQAFAVPVQRVHEILDPVATTPVPNAPAELPALVNVRGTVAPLLDIRRRLGVASPAAERTGAGSMPGHDAAATPAAQKSRFIVLDIPRAEGQQRLAIDVDAVEAVIDVAAGSLEPVPVLGASWPTDLIAGAVRTEARLVVVLEPQALMDGETPARPQGQRGASS